MNADSFPQRKTSILSKIDKSHIGKWDEKIISLCNKINKLENYYTTSSCSGRILLMIEQEKKFHDLFLAVSHELISFDWLKKCQEIGEKFNLVDSEISELKTEVALVLVGLSNLDTLHNFIDVGIGGTGWEEIEKEVLETILSPIGEILGIIEKYNA